MIFLDANSTTVPSRAVIEAVASAMATPANPSSGHFLGAAARSAMERARDEVCLLLPGFLPEGVVFTSGGTEGNNTILKGFDADLVVISNVEHPSVYRAAVASGATVAVAQVGNDGRVDPAEVAELVRAAERPLVSIQYANGETGILQPIRDIVRAAREVREGVFIHTDAAQAFGRVALELDGVDAVTFSGHKLHGPAGTGVLALADPQDPRIRPLINGGGQEGNMRSGTQNVPGAVGLGVACRERSEGFGTILKNLRETRDAFEKILIDGNPAAVIIGGGKTRVPNTSNVMFPGVDATRLVAALDAMEVAVSTGSACSSRRPVPSHVLLAMGLTEAQAHSCVRFSFAADNPYSDSVSGALHVDIALQEIGFRTP